MISDTDEFPSVEELTRAYRAEMADEYCIHFFEAIKEFFVTGSRKKVSNKSVEDLTEAMWMFMDHAVKGIGFDSAKRRRVKVLRAKLEKAIANVPTEQSMVSAVKTSIRIQKEYNAVVYATWRVREVVVYLDKVHEPWTFSSMMGMFLDHGADLKYMSPTVLAAHATALATALAPFFDIADMLLQDDIPESHP